MPITNGDIFPDVYYELLTRKAGCEIVDHREEGGGVRGFSGRNPVKRKRSSPAVRLRERGWLLGGLVRSHGRPGEESFAVLMSAIVRRRTHIFGNRVARGVGSGDQ